MSDAPKPNSQAPIHPVVQRIAAIIEAPNFGRWLMFGLGAASIGLAFADIVIHRRPLFPGEGIWGFYAWFGFAAFAFVVLMGWPLRDLLSRPDDYYGKDDEDA